jgi:hypothetical protein
LGKNVEETTMLTGSCWDEQAGFAPPFVAAADGGGGM